MLVISVSFLGLTSSVIAASTPSLGLASTFGILSSTFTRNVGITTIVGDLGYTTLSGGTTHTVSGTTHVADGTYNTAGTDQGTALAALNIQACTYTFPAGAIDLATDTTHGPIGVYKPGVYCNTPTNASSIGTAGITLDGTGTYIFRMDGALTTVDNSNVITINGASSCNVFWAPSQATTLGANTTFIGTVIDAAGITVGHNTTWHGRALAFGGTVTTDTDTINIDSSCLIIDPVVITDAVVSSRSSGSMPIYGCKDPTALNYNYFSASNPLLCKYAVAVVVPVVIPTVVIPGLPKTGFAPQNENISWFSNMFQYIITFLK